MDGRACEFWGVVLLDRPQGTETMNRVSARRALQRLDREIAEQDIEIIQRDNSHQRFKRRAFIAIVLMTLLFLGYYTGKRAIRSLPNDNELKPIVYSIQLQRIVYNAQGDAIIFLNAKVDRAENVRRTGIGSCPGCRAIVGFPDNLTKSFPLSVNRFLDDHHAWLALVIPVEEIPPKASHGVITVYVRSADDIRSTPIAIQMGEEVSHE